MLRHICFLRKVYFFSRTYSFPSLVWTDKTTAILAPNGSSSFMEARGVDRPIYCRIIKDDDEGAFVPAIDDHKQKLRPET